MECNIDKTRAFNEALKSTRKSEKKPYINIETIKILRYIYK